MYLFQSWIADMIDRTADGRWYYTESKWGRGPQAINFNFHLEIGDNVPSSGVCTLDTDGQELPPPPPTTTAAPTAAPACDVPISFNQPWEHNGESIIEGVCIFNITRALQKFNIRIDLNSETYDIQVSFEQKSQIL